MAKNKFAEILAKENLYKGQVRSKANLSKRTIYRLYYQRRNESPYILERIVNAINSLSTNSYSISDVFPNYIGGGMQNWEYIVAVKENSAVNS